MRIRLYSESDFEEILALFFETVRTVNRRDYSDEQVRAWAPDRPDRVRWKKSFSDKSVFLAESDGKVLGFGELERSGHIDRFYVRSDHIGQGVGKAIYAALETEARKQGLRRLFVEASITAKPFFSRMGFRVCQEQTVTVRDVQMSNFVMEKDLA